MHVLPEWALVLALLGVSLALIFAGKTVAKVLAFVAVGIVGAAIGGTLGLQYLGAGGNLVGEVLGFVLGGLTGILLIALGIGLLVGYAAYLLALGFAMSHTTAFIVGVIFFVVGVALSGEILLAVTAVAGGLLLFDVLRSSGLGLAFSTLLAAGVTLAGLWVQYSAGRDGVRPTPTTTGGSAK